MIYMKAFRLLPVVSFLILSISVAAVYANGYTPDVPLLSTTGVPALGAIGLFSGAISVTYSPGTPVVLASDSISLDLCTATTCVSVPTALKPTSPFDGTYTYTFTPPTSLTGTITIYIKAGSLADENGKIFPSTDTSIGTYVSPGSSSASSSSSSVHPAYAGTPPTLTKQAVEMTPTAPTAQSPVVAVTATLAVLALAGCLLVFVPRKH